MNTEVARKPKHPAYRVWMDVTPEVRQERIQTALRRVLNDERTADIAKDMGLSRSALNMAFLEYAEQDWKTAQVARAQTRCDKVKDTREGLEKRIELCDSKEEAARLTLILAHARDEEKSAQWELERLCRRIYGDDKSAQGSAQASLVIEIRSAGTTNAVQHEPIEAEFRTEST